MTPEVAALLAVIRPALERWVPSPERDDVNKQIALVLRGASCKCNCHT